MKKRVVYTKKTQVPIRLNYSKGEPADRMREAVLDIARNPHRTITEVADTYQVGWKSLQERVKGQIQLNACVGRKPYLSQEEEDSLVRFLIEISDLGFGYTPKRLRYLLLNMLSKDPREFTTGWYQYFMSKHPELSVRRAEALDRLRAASINASLITHYFETLNLAFTKCRELSDGEDLKPHRIFVMDEVGFSPFLTKGYVIAKKGTRSVYSLAPNNRQHLTVVAFASANGYPGKPTFITPKNVSREILQGHFPGSIVLSSDSGYMNDHLYKAWCRYFVSEIKDIRGDNNKWCLLVIDGLNSHTMNPDALDILNDANILSISLPSHSSAALQVHDVSIFGPLKRYFDSKISEHILQHGPNVTLKDLPGLIEEPFEKANSLYNIKSGFRKVGLYPLNLNWVEENLQEIPILKVKSREDRFNKLSTRANTLNGLDDLLNSVSYLDLAISITGCNCSRKPKTLHKSLSHITLSIEDFHFQKSEPTRKIKNMIGENFAQAKILNETTRIASLREKKQQNMLKRNAKAYAESQTVDRDIDEEDEIEKMTTTKRVRKNGHQVKL